MIAPSSSPVVAVTISANQTYQLSLNNSVSLGILKQASHFQVSHTALDAKNGVMIYKYMPAVNYTGTDEVVLSTIKATTVARTGCGNGQDINSNSITYTTSYTTLKINITDK